MNAQTKEALLQKKEVVTKRFKEIMQELYGERLAKIVLYGSYARGDFHEESDIDFLVVLNDENVQRYVEIKNITLHVEGLEGKEGITISALPMSILKFSYAKTPLLYFIRKEGKII